MKKSGVKEFYSSNDDEEPHQEAIAKTEVVLTPMSNDSHLVCDRNFTEDIIEKLRPIGHPNPGVGSCYNCHGWALGYKAWINIVHQRNDPTSLSDQVVKSCHDKGVDADEAFTDELTYAKSESKTITSVAKDNCTNGAIAAYYKASKLTHTARYRKESSSDDSFLWSSKLGNGQVVVHKEAEDLASIYGDTIDFYNIDLL